MKQLARLLSVWSLCCCFQENLAQSFIPKCTSHEMTVQWPNGTFKQCLHCAECQPGRGLYPDKCGDIVKYPVKTHECKKCENGKTFSDTYDTSGCKVCHLCAEHEVVTQNCTLSSDTKCNKTCNSGYFFSEPQHVCKRCSYCCFDGKDEEQPQCINQGLQAFERYCSPRPDRTCTPLIISTTTGSVISTEASSCSTKHDHKIEWILSCLGIGSLLIGVILLYCLWRRSKKKIRRQYAQNLSNLEDGGCNLRVAYKPSEGNQGGLMQQEDSTLQVQLSENEGLIASAASTPQGFHKGIPHTGGLKEQVPPVNVPSKNFPGLPDRTEEKKADESARETLLADNKDGEDDVSEDIDGNGAQGGRERRGSFSGFQSLCRKLSNPSNNYEPLSGEDPDQPIEAVVPQRKRFRSNSVFSALSRKSSIPAVLKEENTDQPLATIKRSPDSPEVQAGSRVEFQCVLNGCQQVLYRWFKDEQELPGGNNSTLILDPLKMQDFGSYRCEVKSDKRVESTLVELDVTPAEGKSYKTLTEVFQSSIYLRNKVANLLRREVGGLAGYKHVASHYKMDIDVLEQCENPGEGVIAKLGAEHPDLAVYHFCKVLKDKEIRRLDIVKELKGHLI